ncbi:50S ribosomal protein L22, partial [Acinetobacter baumannii]
IRGKMAVPMVHELRFKAGRGAFVLHKVLVSAISNAEANHNLDADTLRISEVKVDEGPKMKRMQARAMGRGNRILKRTAHITIVVSEGEP